MKPITLETYKELEENGVYIHYIPEHYNDGTNLNFSIEFRKYKTQTGWYNESYDGGIYMLDATWVRVYGGKGFLVANTIASTADVIAYYSDERLKDKKGNIQK